MPNYDFELLRGNTAVGLDDVAHVFVPGRGRDETGMGLSQPALERVVVAKELFETLDLANRGGTIVISGYKTPADHNGEAWSIEPKDAAATGISPEEKFMGIPEAILGLYALSLMGVDPEFVRCEPHSIDTATNFAFSRRDGLLGYNEPIAVVAQRQHLQRMLDVIVPRTLPNPVIGVVVPEQGTPDPDSVLARMFSQAVLLGIRPDSNNMAQRIGRRADYLWRAAELALKVTQHLKQQPGQETASQVV